MNLKDELLGDSPGIEAVRKGIERLLQRSANIRSVLIQGETGTGKGLVARALHRAGPRAGGPFVDVNCAAIPETLLEAEMFGFERGAFTDARQAKAGLFQTAHRGTLFLDEIGALPESLQTKLLKVIEDHTVRRLGSTRSESVDVWIIAATSVDLLSATRDGRFRPDLYHRLAIFTILLPPLRERGQDIVRLAEHFLARACADHGLPARQLSEDACESLLAYPWPGNVRELSNVLERAALLSDEQLITAAILTLPAPESRRAAGAGVSNAQQPAHGQGSVSMDDAMRIHVNEVLAQTGWNLSRAAALLGIARNTLHARIRKYGLEPPAPRPAGRAASGRHGLPATPASEKVLLTEPKPAAPPASLGWGRRLLAFLRVSLSVSGDVSAFQVAPILEDVIAKAKSFRGHIAELTPLGAMAMFGVDPIENATSHAAHAALAIVKGVERAQVGKTHGAQASCAIHSRWCLIARGGDVIGMDPAESRAVSEVLDQLIQSARPQTIVVDDAAARFIRRRLELEALEAVSGSPVGMYQVMGRERVGLGLWGRLAPFVGRDRELEFLRSRLSHVESGHGQLIALVGDAGVGKSRLLWEFLQLERTPDRLVLETGTLSYSKSTSYLPMLELLRNYFELDNRDDPQQVRARVEARIQRLEPSLAVTVPALLALLDVPVDDSGWRALTPPQRRERTHEAVRMLIASESRARTVILVFEDLHWADPETSALLDSLIVAIGALQVFVVVTYRPGYEQGWTGWSGRSYHTQISVDPLSRDSMEKLVETLVGADPTLLPLQTLLVNSAQGNPLFLEEMVRNLVETGILSGVRAPYALTRPVTTIEIPTTVEEVLAARMDRLSADAKHVLQCAAVIGTDVALALLEKLAKMPLDTLRSHLSQLLGAGFLHDAPSTTGIELAFRHSLTHEVAYRSLPNDQQEVLHAHVVTAIEELYSGALGEHSDRLADHAIRGAVWDKAVDYLRAAGNGAFSRGSIEESLGRYDTAMSLLARLPRDPAALRRGIDVRMDLHSPLIVLGQVRRLLELHQDAERLATELGEPNRLARVLHRMAWYSWLSATPEEGIRYAQRSLDIATEIADVDGQVLASHILAQCLYSSGRYDRANALFRETVDGANAERAKQLLSITIPAYTSACAWLAQSLTVVGDLDQALLYGKRAIEAAETDQHPQSQAVALTLASIPLVYKGQAAMAVELTERALAVCETKGLINWYPGAMIALGHALAAVGRLDEGLPYLERAPAAYEGMGLRTQLSLFYVWWAEGLLQAGRREESLGAAQRAVDVAIANGEKGNEAQSLLVMADVLAAGEQPEYSTVDVYKDVQARAEALGMRPLLGFCQLGLGRLYLSLGERDLGTQHLAQAQRLFAQMGMRPAVAQVEAALAH